VASSFASYFGGAVLGNRPGDLVEVLPGIFNFFQSDDWITGDLKIGDDCFLAYLF
jgi:hypothetical protein